MRTSHFDYVLPDELIAQTPTDRRDAARLLVLPARAPQGSPDPAPLHRHIGDLPTLLSRGTLLVLNDTRVQPARLRGHKASGGRVEVLLWRRLPELPGAWTCMYGSAKPPRPGGQLRFGSDERPLEATVVGRDTAEPELVVVRFAADDATVLSHGEPPLPPYIHREGGPDLVDRERYQTVYARQAGAVAAPTAGLHFTPELLARLEEVGVELRWLTLHVGPGTFRPVRADEAEEHQMHEEPYAIPAATAEAVERARAQERPICAVGTTVLRALESAAASPTGALAGEGSTRLFVLPGYRFRIVDRLLTNFHLPRSTLLMLASAFVGRERLLAAYVEAIRERYRFYSFGDATLLDRDDRLADG